MFRKLLFIGLISFVTSPLYSQVDSKAIDSIISVIVSTQQNDSTKAKKLTNEAARNRYNIHTKEFIKEAENIANKQSKILPKVDVYLAWGNYYFYNSALEKAEESLQHASTMMLGQNSPLLQATIQFSLSGIYRKKGNIPLAISTLLQSKAILDQVKITSLDTLEKKRLITRQIVLFNTLANFYNQMGEFDKAETFYDDAFDKAIKLKSQTNAGAILSNKGNLLINIGKYEEALQVLQRAKQLKIEGKSKPISVASTNREIAQALYKTKKYDKALTIINEAIDYYENNADEEGLRGSYNIRGNILIAKKAFQKAVIDCEKAKSFALNSGILEDQEKSCLCLSEAYAALGNDKQALHNFKLHQKAKDSIFSEKNIKKITQLEMQYTYDKEKQRQQLITASKEREAKDTIKSLGFILVALLLVSVLLFRFNQVKKRNNAILKEKNTQISETLAVNQTLLKETHHRVKNNLQIISSLLNMQSKFLKDDKSKEIVEDSQNRIRSMSLIHQHLYQGEHLTSIESTTYFTKLLDSLSTSYGIDLSKVAMQINIESMLLDIDTAIPLGLILNELISNAFKHGIDREKGKFYLSFKKINSAELRLIIKDNGPGIPDLLHKEKSNSYGMKLVNILSKKLKADLEFINHDGLEVQMNIHHFKIIT